MTGGRINPSVLLVLLSTACLATAAPTIGFEPLVDPPLNSAHNDTVVCVYPLSGQYGFLPRLLYYISLIFAIIGRYQKWLVLGALASALSFSASTAIHSMVLVNSRSPVFDLDILGCWAVLTTGCMAFTALVHWSSTIQRSKARVVLVLWGCLIGTGVIFGRAELQDMHSEPVPACRSPSGVLLRQPLQVDGSFNCTYSCFSAKSVVRSPSETMVVPTEDLQGPFSKLGSLLLVPILAAAYKSVGWNMQPHNPSELCTRWVMVTINGSMNTRISQHMYNAACGTWYGGFIILFHCIRRAKFRYNRKFLITAILVYPWLLIELLLDLLTPPLFVGNIVVNELMLMKSSIPVNESMYDVGQWGPCVAAAMVVLATLINRLERYRRARKKRKERQSEMPTWPGPAMPGSPGDRQETGIVMPALTHQETLKWGSMTSSTR